jgi:hypothetical protein
MDKLVELLEAARSLSRDERRRLIGELDAIERRESGDTSGGKDSFSALLAVSGTAHSDFTDVSTDKYAHVAAAHEHER